MSRGSTMKLLYWQHMFFFLSLLLENFVQVFKVAQIWGTDSPGFRGMNFRPSAYLYSGTNQTHGPTTTPHTHLRLEDRYGLDPGPNSEPWLGPPHIARRSKMLGLMLSSSISLIQWHTIHGSPWWTLMCFWVSRHWWGSGHRGQGSMGGTQPCPIACTPRGRKNQEEGRREAGVTFPSPPLICSTTDPHPGGAWDLLSPITYSHGHTGIWMLSS